MAFDVRYCNPDLASGDNDGSSEANAFQSVSAAETYIESNGPGVHMYFKRTSSRVNATIDLNATFADTTKKTILEGYETTIGDKGKFQIGHSGNGQIRLRSSADGVILRNFDVEYSRSDTNGCVYSQGMTNVIENCKVHNLNTTADRGAIRYTQDCTIINNEVSAAAPSYGSTTAVIFGSNLRGGIICYNLIKGAKGIENSNRFFGFSCIGNVIMPNTADSVDLDMGIQMTLAQESSGASETRNVLIAGNTIFNFQTTGIEITEQTNDTDAYGNMFTQNLFFAGDSSAKGFLNSDSTNTAISCFSNNAMNSDVISSSNRFNGFGDTPTDHVVLYTGNPFVDNDPTKGIDRNSSLYKAGFFTSNFGAVQNEDFEFVSVS
tara:strand:- start:199 stop:1332 length:1134 start_codon:yes stop_codon:yes gene_type:complete